MPQAVLRSGCWKSTLSFHVILTEGVKSAVPTMKLGRFWARGLQTRPEDFLEVYSTLSRTPDLVTLPHGRSHRLYQEQQSALQAPWAFASPAEALPIPMIVRMLTKAFIFSLTSSLQDKVVQLPVTGKRDSLESYTFLQTGITDHAVAARCLVAIAMPTALATPWPRGPLFNRHVLVTDQMHKSVLEQTCVAVGEDEAVSVEVIWIGW
ncbi:hypothetical protein KCU59_g117, partial [Aureobasidium melanogenum]